MISCGCCFFRNNYIVYDFECVAAITGQAVGQVPAAHLLERFHRTGAVKRGVRRHDYVLPLEQTTVGKVRLLGFQYVQAPAARMRPLSSARMSAASSTLPPRAAFRKIGCFAICLKRACCRAVPSGLALRNTAIGALCPRYARTLSDFGRAHAASPWYARQPPACSIRRSRRPEYRGGTFLPGPRNYSRWN